MNHKCHQSQPPKLIQQNLKQTKHQKSTQNSRFSTFCNTLLPLCFWGIFFRTNFCVTLLPAKPHQNGQSCQICLWPPIPRHGWKGLHWTHMFQLFLDNKNALLNWMSCRTEVRIPMGYFTILKNVFFGWGLQGILGWKNPLILIIDPNFQQDIQIAVLYQYQRSPVNNQSR